MLVLFYASLDVESCMKFKNGMGGGNLIRILFASCLCLAACGNDSDKEPSQTVDPECTTDAQCADKGDKTKCDTENKVCVKPQDLPECTKDEQCADKGDKTKCDTENGVCAKPADVPECTKDEQCANKGDKTRCDTENQVCAKPEDLPECTRPEHCADKGEKTVCDVVNQVCVKPQESSGWCGDGNIGDKEVCDRSNLGGKTCRSWPGFVGGTLACDSTCHFDTAGCIQCTDTDLSLCAPGQVCLRGKCEEPEKGCGDGTVGADEDCESGVALTATCANVGGFVGGVLACNAASCTFDTSKCVVCTDSDTHLCASDEICSNGECKKTKCGDNVIEGKEKCDGSKLNGKSCADWSEFVGGTLQCGSTCDDFDTSKCVRGRFARMATASSPPTWSDAATASSRATRNASRASSRAIHAPNRMPASRPGSSFAPQNARSTRARASSVRTTRTAPIVRLARYYARMTFAWRRRSSTFPRS